MTNKMSSERKTALIVGILFIIGTASGIMAGALTAPIRAGLTYPLNVSASETQWIIGYLFALLMALSLSMVPVLLYPILKKHNEVLAFGCEIYGKTGATNASNFQTLSSMLIAAGHWITGITGIVFSIFKKWSLQSG